MLFEKHWLQWFFLVCIECSFGLYGIDCMERCSEHCKYNEPCDHVNGVCPKGCQDGYIGNQCDKCKYWSLVIT